MEKHKGVFGIPLAFKVSDISCVDGALKLLTSNSKIVFDLVWEDLQSFMENRTREPATRASVALSLHGKLQKLHRNVICLD